MASYTVLLANSSPIEVNDDGTPPSEFMIFAPGENIASHAPYTCAYDPSRAQELYDIYSKVDGRDLVSMDVDHLTFCGSDPASHAAIAWFKLTFEETGVWAREVEWTQRGMALMADRGFRFISPAFEGTNVTEDGAACDLYRVLNVAVTNVPATVNPEPLLNSIRSAVGSKPTLTTDTYLASKMTDANKRATKEAPPPEAEKSAEVEKAALADEQPAEAEMSPEDMMAAIEALKAENADLKAKLADAEGTAANAVAARNTLEKDIILNALTSEGYLFPELKPIYRNMSMEDLKAADKTHRAKKPAGKGASDVTKTTTTAVIQRKHVVQPGAVTNVSRKNI